MLCPGRPPRSGEGFCWGKTLAILLRNIMNIIVTDLEGTLTTGSSWRGFRSYFKQNYSALAYNLFFARFLLRFPLMKLGLLNHQKTMSA